MPIEDTSNSYEYKLKAAGLTEPLSTYLSDPLDPDRLKTGFPAVVTNPLTGVNSIVAGTSTLKLPVGESQLSSIPQRVIDPFGSTAAWSSSSAGVPVLATANDAEYGQYLQITTDGTTNNHDVVRVCSFRMDQGQSLSLAVMPDANISLFHVDLSVGGTTFAKYVTFADDAVPGVGGGSRPDYFAGFWRTITLNAMNALTYAGGAVFSDLADVRAIRIRVKTGTAVAGVVKIAQLKHLSDKAGLRVIWQFDDARINQYTNAYPILTQRGYKGTIAIDVASFGQTLAAYNNVPLMTESQWLEMYANGWEGIGHHSLSMNGASASTIQGMIDTFRAWVKSRGGYRGASHWAYVGGWFDMASSAIVTRQFLSARRVCTTNELQTMPVRGSYEPRQIGSNYLGQAYALATAKAKLDAAAACGNGLIIFTGHNIVPSYTAEPEDWLTTDFAALVDYAKSLGFVGSTFDAEFGTMYP